MGADQYGWQSVGTVTSNSVGLIRLITDLSSAQIYSSSYCSNPRLLCCVRKAFRDLFGNLDTTQESIFSYVFFQLFKSRDNTFYGHKINGFSLNSFGRGKLGNAINPPGYKGKFERPNQFKLSSDNLKVMRDWMDSIINDKKVKLMILCLAAETVSSFKFRL